MEGAQWRTQGRYEPEQGRPTGAEGSDSDLDATPLALPLYERSKYARVLEVMDDRDLLPPTYDAWSAHWTQLLRSTQTGERRLLVVPLDPDEFCAWCDDNGFSRDGIARLAYVEEQSAES
jgi:hypothetical protein